MANLSDDMKMQFQQNFSQDKLSLGANDQPISIAVIPGKLTEEQQETQRVKEERS